MRFSLRSMLIAVAILAPTIGWMGKQWTESPETFFQALRLWTTVGPFVLLGLTVIVAALRDKPKRPRLAAWGMLLLAIPMLGSMLHSILLPTGQPIQVLSTQRLLKYRLPAKVDEPWLWNELQRRSDNNQLDQNDVDEAISVLINHMKKTKPNGWNQPMHWQEGFLSSAGTKGLITKKNLIAFSEAYYPSKPWVLSTSGTKLQSGKSRIAVVVDYRSSVGYVQGIDVGTLHYVDGAILNGLPIKPESRPKYRSGPWEVKFALDLPPGKHELALDVEMAFVERSLLLKLPKSTLTPAKWPQALKRWKSGISVPIEVIDSTVR